MTRHKGKQSGISAKVIAILDIYTMIAGKNHPTVKDFAEKCEVTERTVYRYLAIINVVDPIEFDKERGGYHFIYGDRTKKLKLSREELMILFATGQMVSSLGSSFQNSFEGIVNRMVAGMGKALPGEKPGIIVKIPEAARNAQVDDYFRSISRCMTDHCSVEITYRAQHSKEMTRRIVDPYGLVYHRGAWLLIAYCHLRRQIRTFALDRILDVTERGLLFKTPEGFDLEDFLSQSWGVFRGKRVHVTVRFLPEVAVYVLRKDRWHPSERRKVLEDGSVELSFIIRGLEEMKGWIYSWIPFVEVMKPKWLREQIVKELEETAWRHGQDRSATAFHRQDGRSAGNPAVTA